MILRKDFFYFAHQNIKLKMIQRIQSIFLLISGLVLILVLFFPVWSSEVPGQYTVLADAISLKMMDPGGNILKEETTIFIAILATVGALNSLFSIFRFKNRKFQIKLGMLTVLIDCLLIGAYVFAITKGQDMLGIEDIGSFHLAFYMPFISLIFTSLGNYYIKKDEKLVRSVDRLR